MSTKVHIRHYLDVILAFPFQMKNVKRDQLLFNFSNI